MQKSCVLAMVMMMAMVSCWGAPACAGQTAAGAAQTAKSSPDRFTNTAGMGFSRISPGEFTMGSPRDELGRCEDERPHAVAMKHGFYMQTTEVTQAQWKAVMGNNPSMIKQDGDKNPVENVSWNDAHDFIKKLNFMEDTTKYRLPTEAEWEYACRAGTETSFFSGDIKEVKEKKNKRKKDPLSKEDDTCIKDAALDVAGWYCSDSQGISHAVASKKPNPWGIFDMHGNVAEFCEDWYGEYPAGPNVDPAGPGFGKGHVIRGGSWKSPPEGCRSSFRGGVWSGAKGAEYGFRVVKEL